MKVRLDCPLPKLDFDMITLGHGSGGLLTNKLLDSGVFNLFDNKILHERHDGAVINTSGKTAFTTDSFVVSPIFFPGGNIGDLAINGTINDIAMCGGIPEYISVGFILEEGLMMEEFWDILVTMKYAAENANVQIVTGDTKVVEKGKGDKIFINTTGIGPIHPDASISAGNIEVGDKIIVNGELARHGVAIMSVREGLEFETEIISDTAPLDEPVRGLLDEFGRAIHLLRDPTRGGVATVLAEIAKSCKIGVEIFEKELPINEEVGGACELLGLDPLYVANEGLFVGFVKAEVSEQALDKLRTFETCKNARIIGEVVESHFGQVVLHSKIGGKRVVNMLPGEQLPRIC